MKKEHTPTPYKVGSIGDQTWILDDSGRYLAEMVTEDSESLYIADHEERRATANFIVTACNSYDDLLNALKVALCEIERNGTSDRERVLKQIHDALAKAVA